MVEDESALSDRLDHHRGADNGEETETATENEAANDTPVNYLEYTLNEGEDEDDGAAEASMTSSSAAAVTSDSEEEGTDVEYRPTGTRTRNAAARGPRGSRGGRARGARGGRGRGARGRRVKGEPAAEAAKPIGSEGEEDSDSEHENDRMNSDQVVQSLRTLFEASLHLHATGQHMEVGHSLGMPSSERVLNSFSRPVTRSPPAFIPTKCMPWPG